MGIIMHLLQIKGHRNDTVSVKQNDIKDQKSPHSRLHHNKKAQQMQKHMCCCYLLTYSFIFRYFFSWPDICITCI